jgi:hypothetical protein
MVPNISQEADILVCSQQNILKKLFVLAVSCLSVSRASEWIFMKYDTFFVKINSDKHLHEEVHALLRVFQP